MKRMLGYALALGTLVGAGALLYRFGLSDEAKEGVKAAARSVKDACDDISARVSDLYGTEVKEDMTERLRVVWLLGEGLGFLWVGTRAGWGYRPRPRLCINYEQMF